MKNLWGDIKNQEKLLTPNIIIEQQSEILREMTEESVEVKIKRNLNNNLRNSEFSFDVSLASYRMENYKYPIFRIEYDINIYPVKVILDINISDIVIRDYEVYLIGNNENNEIVLEAKNKESFVELLGRILSSNKITNAVRSIISLSDQIGKDPSNLPF